MALLRSVLEGRTGLCESDRNPVDWNGIGIGRLPVPGRPVG